MVLQHLLNKMIGDSVTSPPLVINVSINFSTEGTPASSLSNTSGNVEEAVVVSKSTTLMVKPICLSTRASQIRRTEVVQEKRKTNE